MRYKKSLAETHPEIAKQWHPTKNGDLSPNNVTPGSNKKVWWKCDKGDDHEWIVRIGDRVNYQTGCPICSKRMAVLNPKGLCCTCLYKEIKANERK